MNNNEALDAERDKVFASEKDPTEELAEIRAQEALEAPEEEVSAETEPEPESEDEATGDDDLEAFVEPEEVEEPTSEEPAGEEEAAPEEEDAEETKAPELYKFKADGQNFEFTQEEINEQFQGVFGKAMKFTQKMQKIAPYSKMVSALEEENISEQDLNLAIDMLKGDKGALQKLITEKSIDIYDLGTEGETTEYQAKNYGKSEHEQQLADIDREISADPEYSQTVAIIGSQWDERSRQTLSDNPEWITGLHEDVKSGVFDKVAPEATKMKMLDGGNKPDIEYYLLAGQQMQQKANATPIAVEDPAQVAAQQFKDDSAVANKKRSASSTRSRAGSNSVVDYLDDDDEKFDAWYSNIMNNS